MSYNFVVFDNLSLTRRELQVRENCTVPKKENVVGADISVDPATSVKGEQAYNVR